MRKFTLTAEDLEGIAPTLSAALPHPLNILFDDVTDTLEGGDQEVYNTVGFGIGISKTIAGDWETTQEAVNNLARAEIDKKIHDAEAGIAQLKHQRAKLDKAGADAYEVFLRRP